jgi:hypothetical protein
MKASKEVVAPKSFALLSQRTEEVRETRQSVVLTELLQTKELASLSSNILRGDTYRVVLSKPIGGALNARADGMLDAFVKADDGRIIAVARLQRASSALLSSATMLAGHAMLAQISAQIDRLQGSVDQVLAKLDAERLGKVDAALMFLGHAGNYRPEHHAPMLLHAVQVTSEVLAGALRDVEQSISAVPEPQEWNLSRAFWDKTGQTAEGLDRAAGSMRTALLCLQVLGQTQLQLNGEDGAAGIMREWLARALDLPLAQAELLARRLPITAEEGRRDRFWIDVRHSLERASEQVADMLDPDRPTISSFYAPAAQLAALNKTGQPA